MERKTSLSSFLAKAGLFSPGEPVNWVTGMLEQVGTAFKDQSVEFLPTVFGKLPDRIRRGKRESSPVLIRRQFSERVVSLQVFHVSR